MVLLMSCLPITFTQQSCDPYADPTTCNVTSCLTCSPMSASCSRTTLSPTLDTITCMAANLSECQFLPCEVMPGHISVCTSNFDVEGNSNFAAYCFPIIPSTLSENCDSDCLYESKSNRLSCCCYENDCLRNSLSLNVSTSVVTTGTLLM